ncbi:MAG TPA: PPC domain-containing DNA-binding protein [Candidatus Saccharimonadales bacterium]|nr:PPC domain-containing DNA-binding protein [Candidatus Saccharimonadales bacterium]
MLQRFDGFNYFLRLDSSERLSEALEQFAAEAKPAGGWLNGLGTASEATLGFYGLENKSYHWQIISRPMEVVSLTGNLALDETGKPVYHLHGVLAGDDYQTIGGHIKDLVVGATLELFVHRAYQPLQRHSDKSLGLQTLAL